MSPAGDGGGASRPQLPHARRLHGRRDRPPARALGRAEAAEAGGHARSGALAGRNIALIFEKTSTRTRCAFEVAAYDQGAHVTYLGPTGSQIGHKESVKDTARVLGRMYDGIEYRGYGQERVEALAAHAGVPVWNGLTDEFHPTQVLADVLTMVEHAGRRPVGPLLLLPRRRPQQHGQLAAGGRREARHGHAAVRAPRALAGRRASSSAAGTWAAASGGAVTLTDDPAEGVRGGRFPLHRRLGVDGRGPVGLGARGSRSCGRTR